MKQTCQKGLALLLTLVMCLCIMPTIQVSATTKTRDQAIEWVKSQVGKGLDMDHEYGNQCVDLIFAYYDFLGVPRSSGNGGDYAWNALPSGWQRLQGVQPEKGDILVYSGSESNPYGHVGIYESDYAHYHQNVDGYSTVQKFTAYAYNDLHNPYWGVIRPNWSDHSCLFNASATVTKAPTRTTTGVRVCYCSCGKTETQTIPAIPYTTSLAEGIYTLMTKLKTGSYIACNGTNDAYIWDGDGADLFWLFHKNTDGTYSIENAYYRGKYMTIENSSMVFWGNLGVSAYTGGNNQKFYVIPEGSSYRLVAKHSYMTLDTQGGHTANGTNVQQFHDNGSDAQRWAIHASNPKMTLSFSPPTVRISAGKAYLPMITIDPAYEFTVTSSVSDDAVCSVSLGEEWIEWINTLVIRGKSIGSTAVTLTFKDKNSDIVYDTKTITVTVHEPEEPPTVSITCTNDVAPTQTVTLTMRDDVGLKGYFWGGMTSVSFIDISGMSKTIAETVSSAGTYQLVVKDGSGNIAYLYRTFYKTKLDASGGSVSPASVLTMKGNSFTPPVPKRSGYTFKNWNTKSDGSGDAYVDAYAPTATATLYAIWEKGEPAVYTLTYNANGGIGAPAQQIGNGMVTLSSVQPTREGYTFLGWAASSSATKAQYASGAPFDLNRNVTLYAVWQKNGTPVDPTADPTIAIHNYAASKTVGFRTTITFSVDPIQNPVSGAQVHWYIDGQDQGTGDSFTVSEAKNTYTVQARYIKDGTVLAESQTEKVIVKTGFFARLIAFFRALFGNLPKQIQEVYDVESYLNRLP